MLLCTPLLAIDDRADIEKNEPVSAQQPIAWKLTPSAYSETAARSAADINLRGNREIDTFSWSPKGVALKQGPRAAWDDAEPLTGTGNRCGDHRGFPGRTGPIARGEFQARVVAGFEHGITIGQ